MRELVDATRHDGQGSLLKRTKRDECEEVNTVHWGGMFKGGCEKICGTEVEGRCGTQFAMDMAWNSKVR